MPQMSPLPWLILMLFFIMFLLTMAFQMFHTSPTNTPKISLTLTKTHKTWQW